MQYEMDLFRIKSVILKRDFLLNKETPFILQNSLHLNPFIETQRRRFGEYKLLMEWELTVIEAFTKKHLYSATGSQEAYFISVERKQPAIAHIISRSEQIFISKIHRTMEGTALSALRIEGIERERIADYITEYISTPPGKTIYISFELYGMLYSAAAQLHYQEDQIYFSLIIGDSIYKIFPRAIGSGPLVWVDENGLNATLYQAAGAVLERQFT
ncbi:MAG: hypothetical protein QM802_23035 [Agriterribacter sp.]